ncbi:MAG: stage 0 sporulation family protein [Lachnospiraceae bacterium]|nr:stage 0 sporulation family protein [Lachnospiraceae bacterium]
MTTIIGVRFKTNSKIYYFDPTGFDVKTKDYIIVETARGIEFGEVVLGPKDVDDSRIVAPLKPIIRIATLADFRTMEENKQKEKEAFAICLEKIQNHGLEMKLIDSEYTFDRSKLLFYFTADGRIDFRELVKDLAAVFRTRIELRQIGVRDETRMIGGYGICGRPLCCSNYLSDFAPVSIKMAKDQGLSLNPSKISGVCGRLMCCLQNEEEAYLHLNSTLPDIGSRVKTIDGFTGEVQRLSVLKQRVTVLIETDNDEKEVREYPVNDLEYSGQVRSSHKSFVPSLPEEEAIDEASLKELQLMENEDNRERIEAAINDDLLPQNARLKHYPKGDKKPKKKEKKQPRDPQIKVPSKKDPSLKNPQLKNPNSKNSSKKNPSKKNSNAKNINPKNSSGKNFNPHDKHFNRESYGNRKGNKGSKEG